MCDHAKNCCHEQNAAAPIPSENPAGVDPDVARHPYLVVGFFTSDEASFAQTVYAETEEQAIVQARDVVGDVDQSRTSIVAVLEETDRGLVDARERHFVDTRAHGTAEEVNDIIAGAARIYGLNPFMPEVQRVLRVVLGDLVSLIETDGFDCTALYTRWEHYAAARQMRRVKRT